MQEKHRHIPLTDVLEIHFLNLEAAKKAKEKSSDNQLINWLRFIGATDKKERAMLALKSPILQMLNEKIDIVTLSPVERKLYESRMKLKSDITTIAETQFSAGLAEGEARGLEQGFADGVRQTASALKRMGLAVSQIAQATGLSETEIEKMETELPKRHSTIPFDTAFVKDNCTVL